MSNSPLFSNWTQKPYANFYFLLRRKGGVMISGEKNWNFFIFTWIFKPGKIGFLKIHILHWNNLCHSIPCKKLAKIELLFVKFWPLTLILQHLRHFSIFTPQNSRQGWAQLRRGFPKIEKNIIWFLVTLKHLPCNSIAWKHQSSIVTAHWAPKFWILYKGLTVKVIT